MVPLKAFGPSLLSLTVQNLFQTPLDGIGGSGWTDEASPPSFIRPQTVNVVMLEMLEVFVCPDVQAIIFPLALSL